MSATWSTTVTQTLGLLREAIVALVPIAEKAQMPWRDGEAYDDWDAIASCLYDSIVVRTICCAKEAEQGIALPKYDMVYPSYKDAFILVEGDGVPEGVLAAFVGFAGTSPEFGCVKWVKVHASGHAHDQKIESSPYDGCQFYLVRGGMSEMVKVHTLTVGI